MYLFSGFSYYCMAGYGICSGFELVGWMFSAKQGAAGLSQLPPCQIAIVV